MVPSGIGHRLSLEHVLLFRDVPEESLALMRAALRHKIMPAGRNIVTIDQIGEAAYIILKGTAKVHVEQSDGTDVVLAILGPGEVIGEMGLLDGQGRSANVMTLEEVQLLWVDRATFQGWLETMPLVAYNLALILSRRLRLANAQIQALATLDVYGRVAHQLLTFAAEYGAAGADGSITIPLRLTQSDLADLVGASRVRVNHVLVHFKQEGFIAVGTNHRITLHDVQALRERT